jgi:histidinol phosphatase-like enzyme (inositol monophosphatase family)
MQDYFEFQKFAKHLSIISGEVIKKYFRSKISVDQKRDNSPVTIADKKAEELMREVILKTYPDHGIIGEEFDDYEGSSEFKWVLDPIDGTKSFICGTVNFGTLIALLQNGEPILGVFNQPILNEFLLGDNKTTFLNEKIVRVRNCDKLSDAVLITTDHLNVEKYQNAKKFDSLIHNVKFYRGWGDCYGYYLLSTGFADIMLDPIMSFWDIAAIVPIVRGAGGIISDYHGCDPLKGNSIIAASPGMHSQVIKELNS